MNRNDVYREDLLLTAPRPGPPTPLSDRIRGVTMWTDDLIALASYNM